MWTYNTFLVMAGAGVLGLLCGLVGTFSVLRRRALIGDVLAHATLPGLGLAFLITGSKSIPVLLLGALATGLIGVAVLAYVRGNTRTKEDAAMAMVLAVFFGGGIALSRYIQNTVSDGSHAGLDSFLFGKTAGMVLADVGTTAVVCVVATIAIFLLYKEFQLVCFDAVFAQSLGLKVPALDFAILALLSLAVVTGLPMVGVVMVAALTIIPPVSARFWVGSLRGMLVLAGAIGAASAVAGVWLSAAWENLPSGPMIVLVAAVFFVASALAAPRKGVAASYARLRRLRLEHGRSTLDRFLADHPGDMAGARAYLKAQGLPTSLARRRG